MPHPGLRSTCQSGFGPADTRNEPDDVFQRALNIHELLPRWREAQSKQDKAADTRHISERSSEIKQKRREEERVYLQTTRLICEPQLPVCVQQIRVCEII